MMSKFTMLSTLPDDFPTFSWSTTTTTTNNNNNNNDNNNNNNTLHNNDFPPGLKNSVGMTYYT